MLSAQRSTYKRNPKMQVAVREPGEGNTAWFMRNAAPYRATVLLLGGTSTADFRLRVAQSHLRDDLSPSHWSHVALLAPQDGGEPKVFEVPLIPRSNFETFPHLNGVLQSPLSDFNSVSSYPNVAIVELPLQWSKVKEQVDAFCQRRLAFDAMELILPWLAFAWGVGRASNPLYDQVGFASAALVEFVSSALEYDLTPAFPSRSSCPEAIWQSACYWHEFPRGSLDGALSEEPAAREISGKYVVAHALDGREAASASIPA